MLFDALPANNEDNDNRNHNATGVAIVTLYDSMVAVEWWDSETDGEPWHDLATTIEWARKALVPIVSVGYLIHRDSTSITIALHRTAVQCGPHTKIPLIAVKRVGSVSIQWEGENE